MKELLTIFVLFLGLGFTNAQSLTFDETVNYINKIIEENSGSNISWFNNGSDSGDLIHGIIAEKNGKIILYSHLDRNLNYSKETKNLKGSFNVFDFEKFNEYWKFFELLDKDNKMIGRLYRFPPTYISKLEKALKHLQTLCVKEKDPFD
ncbi:hypothetical protein NZ698_18540 [Chryseobacterium sp. PBS4-4]|uniref:Uncharacterized protein n=1 Tax=Chryseobacterium edaphi TaxID=2976532 RepID=A0ABT2WAD8_9FLAO|nr:hypothetical protein [Chryseobacterium edaphi]MCU7619182.1 hypothetical protein [Chryseobacterium edaphi]